jgi:hypothetical protein
MKPLDELWPKPLIGHVHSISTKYCYHLAIVVLFLIYFFASLMKSSFPIYPPNIKIRVPQSEENNEKEMDRHTVFVGADRDRSICHHARVEAFLGRIQASAEGSG